MPKRISAIVASVRVETPLDIPLDDEFAERVLASAVSFKPIRWNELRGPWGDNSGTVENVMIRTGVFSLVCGCLGMNPESVPQSEQIVDVVRFGLSGSNPEFSTVFYADGSYRASSNEYCNADLAPVVGPAGPASLWPLQSAYIMGYFNGPPLIFRLWAGGEIDVIAPNQSPRLLLGRCSPADINWDGAIDLDDLIELLSSWGPCEQDDATPVAVSCLRSFPLPYVMRRYWSDGGVESIELLDPFPPGGEFSVGCVVSEGMGCWRLDLDGDGVIGLADVTQVLAAWGDPCVG